MKELRRNTNSTVGGMQRDKELIHLDYEFKSKHQRMGRSTTKFLQTSQCFYILPIRPRKAAVIVKACT